MLIVKQISFSRVADVHMVEKWRFTIHCGLISGNAYDGLAYGVQAAPGSPCVVAVPPP